MVPNNKAASCLLALSIALLMLHGAQAGRMLSSTQCWAVSSWYGPKACQLETSNTICDRGWGVFSSKADCCDINFPGTGCDVPDSSDDGCWLVSSWYGPKACENTKDQATCTRGWDVFDSEADCCSTSFADTGCDGPQDSTPPPASELSPKPTSAPTPKPTSAPTPKPTSAPIPGSTAEPPSGNDCVTRDQLIAINSESTYWPRCDPSQPEKGSATGYVFGHYCTQEWADSLNEMLSALGYCNDLQTVRKYLAQLAWETGYFSTLGQPKDDGSGLIHMIPQNFRTNAQDMDTVFPGQGLLDAYDAADDKQAFFKDSKYAHKSAAAWFKRTNGVIPGCGFDLFPRSLDEQTFCILAAHVDRSEAHDLVSKHI